LGDHPPPGAQRILGHAHLISDDDIVTRHAQRGKGLDGPRRRDVRCDAHVHARHAIHHVHHAGTHVPAAHQPHHNWLALALPLLQTTSQVHAVIS